MGVGWVRTLGHVWVCGRNGRRPRGVGEAEVRGLELVSGVGTRQMVGWRGRPRLVGVVSSCRKVYDVWC